MPDTVIVRKTPQLLSSYSELLRKIQKTFLLAKQNIHEVKIRASWEIGNDINKHVKTQKGRAEYGEHVIQQLSKSLQVSPDYLDRCSKLARKFSQNEISAALRKSSKIPLTLTHFYTLFPVEDKTQRAKLLIETTREGWSSRELKKQSQKITRRVPRTQNTGRRTDFLKPLTGKLHTFRVIHPDEAGWPNQGGLLLDHGFRVYKDLDRALTRSLKPGDIVEGLPVRITTSERIDKDRYFYRAYVEKVIDGDTLWAAIDIGLSGMAREKLRLRGIDCAEMDTPEGKRAARFVKSLLPKGLTILIHTSVSPSYDRFIADVFIPRDHEAVQKAIVTQTVILSAAKNLRTRSFPPQFVGRIRPSSDASLRMTQDLKSSQIEISGQPYYFLSNLLLELGFAVRLNG
ncbi:MAG: DUF1016 family protein [Candidatus Omnitrophica bacterium]|nr:DUF1016 family protein [Candidatus Omnitrophota bacterium]